MKDVFEDGHVDKAIFQSTYLKYWYKDGFNTVEQNGSLLEKHPDKFIVNGRWDPRDGEARAPAARGGRPALEPQGRQALHRRVARERLPRLEAHRPGVLPVPGEVPGTRHHEHPRAQGPDDLAAEQGRLLLEDVDQTATDFPDLNFIIEHAGIPRIDDFAYMAVQEPNVYAGLSVVIGAHMHARPKSFARFMGELLFWVGEDRHDLRQRLQHLDAEVAGRGLRRLADARRRGVLRLPASSRPPPRRRSSGSTRPSSTASRCRRSARCPTTAGEPMQPGEAERRWTDEHRTGAVRGGRRREHSRDTVWQALGTVLDPELDEPITALDFVASCTVSGDGVASVHLRLPTFFCAPNFSFLMVADAYDAVSAVEGVTRADDRPGRPPRLDGDQRRGGRARRLRRDVRGRGGRRARGAAAVLPGEGRRRRAGPGGPAPGRRRRRPRRARRADPRRAARLPGARPAAPAAGALGLPRRRRRSRC